MPRTRMMVRRRPQPRMMRVKKTKIVKVGRNVRRPMNPPRFIAESIFDDEDFGSPPIPPPLPPARPRRAPPVARRQPRARGGNAFREPFPSIGGNDPGWFHAGKNLDLKVLRPTHMPIDTGDMNVILQYLTKAPPDRKMVFGNGELVLERKLGAGVDGAVFLGSIGSLKNKVAMKTIIKPIAMWSGRGWSVNEFLLRDWLREYELMSSLDCPEYPPGERSPGAITCAIGAVAILLKPNVLHGLIILERMDSDLYDFCTEELSRIPQPIKNKIGFHILLQVISKMNRLHRLGVYHGDAHNGNWFVKRTGVGIPDVRLGDMGRSCLTKYDKKDEHYLSCSGYDQLMTKLGYHSLFMGDTRQGWARSTRDLAEYAMFAKTLHFLLFDTLHMKPGVDISAELYNSDLKLMDGWTDSSDPWVIEQSKRTYREFMYEDRPVYGSRVIKTGSMWSQIMDCIRRHNVFTPREWYSVCMEGLAMPGVRCVKS